MLWHNTTNKHKKSKITFAQFLFKFKEITTVLHRLDCVMHYCFLCDCIVIIFYKKNLAFVYAIHLRLFCKQTCDTNLRTDKVAVCVDILVPKKNSYTQI